MPALPQMPTFAEAGMPDLNVDSWQGMLAPADTPKPIVDKLSAEVAKYLALPDFQDKLISNGLEPFISTPEQLAALLKEALATNASIIKKANIKFEN